MNSTAPANGPVLSDPGSGGPVHGARSGGKWEISRAWRDRFAPEGPAHWFALEGDARATLVKSQSAGPDGAEGAPARRVWRVALDDGAFFVKQFHARGWWDRLRWALFGPPARREWRCASAASARGVPCGSPVAWGWRRVDGGPCSVFITAAVDGAQPLPDAWRAAAFQTRRAIVEAVSGLLATAHEAGLVHRDVHPANILIQQASGAEPRAYFVDLYGAVIARRVDRIQALGSLAQLDQWFGRQATRSLRWRFLRGYLARRFDPSVLTRDVLRCWAEAVLRAGRRQARALYARRDRRLRKPGRYFAELRMPDGWRAVVSLRFRNRGEFPEPIHPDRSEAEWRRWLEPVCARLAAGATLDGQQQKPAVLVWDAPKTGDVASPVWGTPARRAFEAGHRLRHRNLPCLWPVAALEQGTGWSARRSTLLLEDRPHSSSLDDLLAGRDPRSHLLRDQAVRAALFDSIGRLLAAAAAAGVYWSQANPSALWIGWQGEGPKRPRALFGRCEGLHFRRRSARRGGEGAVRALLEGLRRYPGFEANDARALSDGFRRGIAGVGGKE